MFGNDRLKDYWSIVSTRQLVPLLEFLPAAHTPPIYEPSVHTHGYWTPVLRRHHEHDLSFR